MSSIYTSLNSQYYSLHLCDNSRPYIHPLIMLVQYREPAKMSCNNNTVDIVYDALFVNIYIYLGVFKWHMNDMHHAYVDLVV